MRASARSWRGRFAALRFPLRGDRVDLVPVGSDLVPGIVRLMNEPSVALWTMHIPYPYTVRHGRAYVRKARLGRRTGKALDLMILRRPDGEVLGGVGLHRLEEGVARAEVGYWLGKEHRGHGYASEAVDVLLRTAFARLGLHRVEARIFPRNRASRRVVQRCGFQYEGRLRDEVQKDGGWQSSLLFSRLSTDPLVRRKSRTRPPRPGQTFRRR